MIFVTVHSLIVKIRHKVIKTSKVGLLSIVALSFPIICFSAGCSRLAGITESQPEVENKEIIALEKISINGRAIFALAAETSWHGFEGKTLWDLLEVILMPIIIVGFSVFLGKEARSFAKRAQHERELATERSREEALRAYLERLTDLILKEKLKDAKADFPVSVVAQAHTFAALRGLDGARKGILLRFLREAGLIAKSSSIISLEGADLNEAVLPGADLSNLSLRDADLSNAVLDQVELQNSELQNADLSNSFLQDANLDATDLRGAILKEIKAANVYLSKANLRDADLRGADLREAILIGANMTRANLTDADLTDADLTGSILKLTDFRGAKIEMDQILDADKDIDAIMPDGTKMNEERRNQLVKGPKTDETA